MNRFEAAANRGNSSEDGDMSPTPLSQHRQHYARAAVAANAGMMARSGSSMTLSGSSPNRFKMGGKAGSFATSASAGPSPRLGPSSRGSFSSRADAVHSEPANMHSITRVPKWIEGALQECALLTTSWKLSQPTLTAIIDDLVRQFRVKPHALQACFYLLGIDYVKSHFPLDEINFAILYEPFLTLQARKEVMEQVRRVMIAGMRAALEERGGNRGPNLKMFTDDATTVIGGRLRETVRASLEGGDRGPPLSASEVAAAALAEIWARQPELCHEQVVMLRRRPLPASLRPFLWKRVLYDDVKLARVQADLARVAARDGVDDLSVSVVSSMLQRSTSEAYSRTAALVQFSSQRLRTRTRDILNRYYHLTQAYDPRHVFLLFPLLHVYPEMDLDGHLSLFTALLQHAPTADQIPVIASNVMRAVRRVRAEVYEHLVGLFQANEAPKGKSGVESLVENWVRQGLVGVLSNNSLLFLWDQFFIDGWSFFEKACVAIVLGIQSRLMQCRTWQEATVVVVTLPQTLDWSVLSKMDAI